MEIINLDKWERTAHFNFFRRMDYPHYNMCMNLDITQFLNYIRHNDLSFYYAMIYAATKALNDIKEFRYRIQDGQVVIHDRIHPSFTDMEIGTDLFKMVTVDMDASMTSFVKKAREKSEAQRDYFVFADVEDRTDLIYITCIPWVSFTHLSHTISFKKDDSVPRISWGKYYSDNNKILLPFSVQVHHSFVDGIHIGRYIDSLQEYLNSCVV